MTGRALTAPPSRVLVADDAVSVRELICLILDMEDDFEVLAQAGDGSEAVRLAEALGPDLVVIDIAMPVVDGITALPSLRRAAPGARIVVLSGFDEPSVADEAYAAGADGFVVKGLGAMELVEAIRAVRDGRLRRSPERGGLRREAS